MSTKVERVWIVGANGRVGKEFAKLLDTRETELVQTDIEDVDVTDLEAVMYYADVNRPEIIINCAGMTNVEECERNKEDAFRVNALGARNLSVAARRIKATLVQLSTDDVFNGHAETPYDEFATPFPLSNYGRSKLAGENFVKDLAQKYLIIRSSWVYGAGENFVTDILEQAKVTKKIPVAGNQFASPTSAKEVAKCIHRLIQAGVYGTYNATTLGYCSRYEFAQKIVELAGLDVEIVRVPNSEVPGSELRPSYAVLDNLMLRISGIETPVSWQEALEDYMRENGYLKQ